jgi:arylsulfatase A
MPHVPLFVSDKFEGKSKQGLYGDVIMEIDWSVGQILDTLRSLGLDDDTIVVFTSDNGPWLSYGDHAGSALPLREGKGTTFDGGQREPCIMWGPGRIPPGRVCSEMCAMFDLLPTFASQAGATVPDDRIIDGRDIWPLMTGEPGARTPHEAFYFYRGMKPEAVRSGSWKLHLPHQYRSCPEPGTGGQPGPYIQKKTGKALFDLRKDVGEQTDVSADHPNIVEELSEQIRQFNADLRKTMRRPGSIKS